MLRVSRIAKKMLGCVENSLVSFLFFLSMSLIVYSGETLSYISLFLGLNNKIITPWVELIGPLQTSFCLLYLQNNTFDWSSVKKINHYCSGKAEKNKAFDWLIWLWVDLSNTHPQTHTQTRAWKSKQISSESQASLSPPRKMSHSHCHSPPILSSNLPRLMSIRFGDKADLQPSAQWSVHNHNILYIIKLISPDYSSKNSKFQPSYKRVVVELNRISTELRTKFTTNQAKLVHHLQTTHNNILKFRSDHTYVDEDFYKVETLFMLTQAMIQEESTGKLCNAFGLDYSLWLIYLQGCLRNSKGNLWVTSAEMGNFSQDHRQCHEDVSCAQYITDVVAPRWFMEPIFSTQMGVAGLIPKMRNFVSLIIWGGEEFNGQVYFSKKKINIFGNTPGFLNF
ncbi:hypothetical protein VP01_132g4 [Puccinia sorghi]|uniref:Uncharacterized protein n=1 Tax=Puccinia sorghi TaxID=27349 RepID=A0A0L6VMF3_9BASI|nr:hypothetical protein VP01_132g4 [Puccinia sorghi]